MSKSSAPKDQGLILTDENLTRNIVKLSGPAVVENLLYTAVWFADTFLIGWLHHPASLAAVSLGGMFVFIAESIFSALTTSTVAMVARAWGAKKYDLAKRIAGQGIALAILAAAAVTFLMWPNAEAILRLMGVEPEVVRLGSLYMRIILLSSFFGFPLSVLNGIMRAAGDTKTPMYVTAAMNAWNVAAAYGLIFGAGPLPALGVRGAAIATASARVVGGGLAMWIVFTGRRLVRVEPGRVLQWNRAIVGEMLRLALPSAGENLVLRAGSIAFTRIVSSLGTESIAAHEIAVTVESLSFMPGFGLSVAATTLVGQSLGAGRLDMAEKSIRASLRYALIVMNIIALVFAVFGRSLAAIFGATPAVVDLAGMAVRLAALEQASMAVQMVLGGSLRGAGDTRSPMYVTFIGTICFRIITVYLFTIVFGWGLAGVWLGTAVDWGGRAALMYWMFRRGRWKTIRVLESQGG
ncbi:MAG: MATE family efflux transporter [Chloroflexi bacterium]|nr:MATE family efflux transporter [Chloroflexota bacterium]